ncbi:MAG: RNA methyltransferase [FCB group bacterium]|nr:RNA methyltransferase [FCB group bacterium]
MKKKTKQKKISADQFSIFGLNGCLELLKSPGKRILRIDLMQGSTAARNPDLQNLLGRHRDWSLNRMPKEAFLKKYAGMRTQGIVVCFQGRVKQPLPSFAKATGNICLVVADNIEDPQNLGQIIRTCEGAGVDGLVFPSHNSAGITNTVLQVSQGAFAHLPLYETANIHTALLKLKKEGFWIIGVENSIQAEKWYAVDFTGKVAIVIGSEGRGIRPLVLKTCDFKATIPMQGRTTSLNVSATIAAILFERLRQVQLKPGSDS